MAFEKEADKPLVDLVVDTAGGFECGFLLRIGSQFCVHSGCGFLQFGGVVEVQLVPAHTRGAFGGNERLQLAHLVFWADALDVLYRIEKHAHGRAIARLDLEVAFGGLHQLQRAV